jgi:putative PIN family toxin of toxin-antitoxin system
MRPRQRIVIDTNVLVSRLLQPFSIPAEAVRKARRNGRLLVSEATMNELADVLARPRLDRYVSIEDRKGLLRQVGRIAELVPIIYPVRECRDPKDDKFLELAWNGRADVIITGDADLLEMNLWRGIRILSATNYVQSPS